MHMIGRTTNLLGTLGIVIADAMVDIDKGNMDHNSSVSAALITLGNYPGHSITSLATALKLSHSATVRLVEKLSHEGFVTSNVDRDRRKVTLSLTRTGSKTKKSIVSKRQAQLADLLLPLGQGEQAQLAALIEKMLVRATKSISDAEQLCRFCDLANCPQDKCPIELQACALRASATPLKSLLRTPSDARA